MKTQLSLPTLLLLAFLRGTVLAQTLTSLELTPSTTPGGQPASGKVSISAPAPTGGVVVNISSSDPGVVLTPAFTLIPARLTSSTFTVTTRAVTSTKKVMVSVTLGSDNRTAPLTVLEGSEFIRGDSNSDRKVDISDPIFTLAYLFLGGSPPKCLAAADANDDESVDISDAVMTLGVLFSGGPGLPQPWPQAGTDPTLGIGCGGDPPAPKLWGFADLHAHPATHLAFGANSDGENGVLYGSPGLHGDAGELEDLGPCDADKHTWSIDMVEDGTQVQAFTGLDGSTGANHTHGGWPNFFGWPAARSLTHQQMHIDWIKRAWKGGLRLMVASATDNKLLSALWANSAGLPPSWDLAQTSDYDSAVRQLTYITQMAAANDWMEIAHSSADAERIIGQGNLALVLGLELDTLTASEMVQLHDEFGVVVVNPIHLANNAAFGGSAAYSNLFNVVNKELWGTHYAVRFEPTIRFRFGAPLEMGSDVATPLFGGVPVPPLVFKDYAAPSNPPHSACEQGLEACYDSNGVLLDAPTVDGHANAEGLNAFGIAGLYALWSKGMIVDLAHMSDLSQKDTLQLARRHSMPVIDSHTDLRAPVGGVGSHNISERKLLPKHAAAIAAVGGMIGLGTEGEIGARTISHEQNTPLRKMLSAIPFTYSYDIDNPRLRIGIGTGDDNLEDSSRVKVTAKISGQNVYLGYLEEPHHDDLAGNDLEDVEELHDFTNQWFTLHLPAGTKASQVESIQLELVQNGCSDSCDNWDLIRFEVFYIGRTEARRLTSQSKQPWIHRFKKNLEAADQSPTWTTALQPDSREVVDIETFTGGDDVGNDKARVSFVFKDGTESFDEWGNALSPSKGLFNGLFFERPYALPQGKKVTDIDYVRIGLDPDSQKGCSFDCDNWNLDSIRIAQPHPMGTKLVLQRSAAPAFRFWKDHPAVALKVEIETEEPLIPVAQTAPNPKYQWVQIRIDTEGDDLQVGMELTGTLIVDGLQVPPISLNQGSKWFDGSSHLTIVKLPQPVEIAAIRRLDIDLSGPKNDDYKIAAIEVQVLGTPMKHWYNQYQDTLEIMGQKGVAIGTDLNGMNPLVPFSEMPVAYPLAPPAAPAGYTPLAGPQKAGNRTFDFEKEGISNVGELPDFLQAVDNVPGVPGSTEPIFHSAHDFVQMWKKVEAAQAILQGN